MPKWIRFEKERPHPSRVTAIWTVYSIDSSAIIRGQVRWYAPWRRYAFNPSPSTVFDPDCLRDIAAFCEERTREHREERRRP